MIRQLLAIPFCGLLASLAFAQETAHLVEPTQPAVPAKPLPKLEVAPQDILSTKVKDLGDRNLIIQEIAPVDLPPPPDPPAPVEMTAERRAAFEARRLQFKQRRNLSLSVTVFRSERYEGKVRTLFCWRSPDNQRQFKA